MNLEVAATPWTYDEFQLMGIELGDTINITNSSSDICSGVVIYLNKIFAYVLVNQEVVKFNRSALASVDNTWEIVGLSQEEIRISAQEWKAAREKIKLDPLDRKEEKK